MRYASCLFQLTKQYQAVVNKKIKYIYFMYFVIGSVGVCVYVWNLYWCFERCVVDDFSSGYYGVSSAVSYFMSRGTTGFAVLSYR